MNDKNVVFLNVDSEPGAYSSWNVSHSATGDSSFVEFNSGFKIHDGYTQIDFSSFGYVPTNLEGSLGDPLKHVNSHIDTMSSLYVELGEYLQAMHRAVDSFKKMHG